MLTKNYYIIFALCLSALSGQILGAASSSSSSSSSLPVGVSQAGTPGLTKSGSSSSSSTYLLPPTFKQTLIKTVCAALPFDTKTNLSENIAPLIVHYLLGNSINVADHARDWIKTVATNAKELHDEVNSWASGNMYINVQKMTCKLPSSYDDRFPIAGLALYGKSGISINLFNKKFINLNKPFEREECCAIWYDWDPGTKTFNIGHPKNFFGILDTPEANNAETIFTYQGDTTLEIPTQTPECTLQDSSSGSLVHVWVDDHKPGIGGSIVAWYQIEEPISLSKSEPNP